MAVGVVAMVAMAGTLVVVRQWERERDVRAVVLAALARSAAPGERVMSPDPGAYRYAGGWPGVVTPNDPLAVVEDVLRQYDVRWLAIERAHVVESLVPLLSGSQRPRWLSGPLETVRLGSDPMEGNSPDDRDDLPDAVLFAVCRAPADERCAT
jgi:hypothetical protein